MSKKSFQVIVIGLGSTGDVHPNVGLALALRQRGRAVGKTTFHLIVLDSVLHRGTTIAGINAKPVERQHVGTTH